MNFCGGYDSEIGDDHRRRYFDSLKPGMTPQQRTAFEKLLSAQNAYVTAHAAEVDQGGPIRVLRTLGSQAILHDLFRTEIVHVERKQWPKLSNIEIASADAWMRREYARTLQRLRMHTPDEVEQGYVTAEHVTDIQKVWETYRNAWAAFARLRYPEGVARIQSDITLERSRLLKTIQ